MTEPVLCPFCGEELHFEGKGLIGGWTHTDDQKCHAFLNLGFLPILPCGKCRSAEGRWKMTAFTHKETGDNLWLCDDCYNEFTSIPIVDKLKEYAECQYRDN